MRFPNRGAMVGLAVLSIAAAPLAANARLGGTNAAAAPREQALHVLNRLGFGPRPGDVERVLAIGVAAYVDQQLAPERIPDAAVAEKLQALPTLAMGNAELFDRFERPLREAQRARKQKEGEGADAAADIEKLRAMIPPENRPRRIIEELSAARVIRAADSPRQLQEVLVDFWMNHFNVFAGKGLDRVLITSFERDVVRPRIFGKFEDLLMATAKSPAMLFYLDNARSVADEANRPPQARAFGGGRWGLGRPRSPEMANLQENAPKGINENYARELMELHTLGVDGGYTQKDVTELARVLTGWSIVPPARGERLGAPGEFVFRYPMHDVGSKTVLGRRFPPGGGIEEGEAMIRILARDPRTAARLSRLLCERLVADDPPKALVERVAKRFLATGGDLRETVRAIVTSPEFYDPQYYRGKVKSPFEYVVSAVRAVGGSTDGRALARELVQMGEPLYLCQPPTGYSDRSEAWVGSGALLARLNFALALAGNTLKGTTVEPRRLLSEADAEDPAAAVDSLSRALVGAGLSEPTRATIQERLAAEENAPSSVSLIAGLILGSPEFQKQ